MHARNGRDANRAVVSTVALGAVLTDLFLNRSRVEVRRDTTAVDIVPSQFIATSTWQDYA